MPEKRVMFVHVVGEERPVRVELQSSVADTARRIRQVSLDIKKRRDTHCRNNTVITRNTQAQK